MASLPFSLPANSHQLIVNVPDAESPMSGTLSVMRTEPGFSNAGRLSVNTPSELEVMVIVFVLFAPVFDVMSSVAVSTTPAFLT